MPARLVVLDARPRTNMDKISKTLQHAMIHAHQG
jgi:hypothetical protein